MNAEYDIDEIAQRAESVLTRAGVASPFRLKPITGGGNNRVYLVESAGAPVVLKVYFRHPTDRRDRLQADFSFSSFAWNVGTRALPRPLAGDPKAGMAVYEFVAGRKLAPGEVTAPHVAEAASFFRAVNEHRDAPHAAYLPEASEACFSIANHVACVDRRMKRLAAIDSKSAFGGQAADLVRLRIRPAWAKLRDAVLAVSADPVGNPLAVADRCVSPSDFGFHNAILATDGHLRFLDFEYAGRDDPAKMACDFFCQPSVPVPREHFDFFIGSITGTNLWGDLFRHRARVLLPVYELKWCCIMLNEFFAVGHSRRSFAGANSTHDVQLARQLAKVRKALDCIGA